MKKYIITALIAGLGIVSGFAQQTTQQPHMRTVKDSVSSQNLTALTHAAQNHAVNQRKVAASKQQSLMQAGGTNTTTPADTTTKRRLKDISNQRVYRTNSTDIK